MAHTVLMVHTVLTVRIPLVCDMQKIYGTSDGSFAVEFDRKVYKLSAVKKAAYKYGGLFHFVIEETGTATVVSLKPTAACRNSEEAAGQFCNEVLDQELREEIASETSGVRDLLLAHAFSKTSLIDSEMETADYDPLPDSTTRK
jgi:His-Xaa-Ser system protein HxsD